MKKNVSDGFRREGNRKESETYSATVNLPRRFPEPSPSEWSARSFFLSWSLRLWTMISWRSPGIQDSISSLSNPGRNTKKKPSQRSGRRRGKERVTANLCSTVLLMVKRSTWTSLTCPMR